MQVSTSNQNKAIQFGMSIKSNDPVNKVIKSRLKNNVQLAKLNKIIEKQAQNDIMDITLFTDGKSLAANVYPRAFVPSQDCIQYCRSFSENGISKMFQGAVGFIEKVANYADKAGAKIKKSSSMNVDGMNVDTILKKMNDTEIS